MGYQALLFCPDDKTARTVTQVLSELDFTVEACIEPFAAVKKLMGQHFDAVVVDCDNEQNATLLFKSARNSTSNQTSLAVAVVEGQAGVAKAFRIGANLVLTKPINIEQAKGTLRVARGLLRKSEPGKPGSATATGSFAVTTAPVPPPAQASAAPSTPAAIPAAAVPKPAPKPAAPTARPSSLPPKPVPPAAKPTSTPAWPAAPVAAKPAAKIPQAPTPVAEKPAEPPAPAAPPVLYSAAVATPPSPPRAPTPTATSEFRPPSAPVAGGAASARAAAEDLFEKPAEAAQSEPAPYAGSAPSFSFGGATEEREAAGGSKKVFIGVAAAVLIVAVGYFGWSHFKGTSSSAQPAATSTPVSAPESSKPSTAQPATTMTATTSAPVSQPDITLGTASASSENERTSLATSEHSRPSAGSTKSANAAPAPAKSPVAEKTAEKPAAEEEQPEAPAMVVKGGKVPSAQPATPPPADAPAPSLIGMGASTAAPLPNLGTSDSGVKPKLQTVSVSQGVSQGLLFKKVAPSYPQNALRMHIDGTVELLATISKDGNITHIKVLSGDAQLAKAASDAVKQWKYKPYLLNGEPVEIQTQVTVNFKLPH
jgi:periplasmic protein TonB